jgi:transcription initiation factor TFIIIB Brf1 subunit/transcription initiation factor TFIIB
MDEMRCPTHPKAEVRIDARAGDVICTECGVVIGDRCVL